MAILRHRGRNKFLSWWAFIILQCFAESEGCLDRTLWHELESANLICRNLSNTEARQPGKVLQVHAGRAAELGTLKGPQLYSAALDAAFSRMSITAGHGISTRIRLENTHWKLVSLFSSRIAARSAEQEIYISLVPQERTVHGFAGCNRLLGHYEAEGQSIRFTGLTTTKKFCAGGMDQERALLEALRMTVKWSIGDEYLELRNTDGELLAQFQRVPR